MSRLEEGAAREEGADGRLGETAAVVTTGSGAERPLKWRDSENPGVGGARGMPVEALWRKGVWGSLSRVLKRLGLLGAELAVAAGAEEEESMGRGNWL